MSSPIERTTDVTASGQGRSAQPPRRPRPRLGSARRSVPTGAGPKLRTPRLGYARLVSLSLVFATPPEADKHGSVAAWTRVLICASERGSAWDRFPLGENAVLHPFRFAIFFLVRCNPRLACNPARHGMARHGTARRVAATLRRVAARVRLPSLAQRLLLLLLLLSSMFLVFTTRGALLSVALKYKSGRCTAGIIILQLVAALTTSKCLTPLVTFRCSEDNTANMS